MSDMQAFGLLWCAAFLMFLALFCIIAAVRRMERDNKSIERFEARVGRAYYSDSKGLTK